MQWVFGYYLMKCSSDSEGLLLPDYNTFPSDYNRYRLYTGQHLYHFQIIYCAYVGVPVFLPQNTKLRYLLLLSKFSIQKTAIFCNLPWYTEKPYFVPRVVSETVLPRKDIRQARGDFFFQLSHLCFFSPVRHLSAWFDFFLERQACFSVLQRRILL